MAPRPPPVLSAVHGNIAFAYYSLLAHNTHHFFILASHSCSVSLCLLNAIVRDVPLFAIIPPTNAYISCLPNQRRNKHSARTYHNLNDRRVNSTRL